MSMNASTARVASVAKALSDQTRLELLLAIAMVPEHSCAELVRAFPVSQATVSHHLKILADAGLVAVRRQGQFGWYSLRAAAVAQHAALLGKTLAPRPRRRTASRSRMSSST